MAERKRWKAGTPSEVSGKALGDMGQVWSIWAGRILSQIPSAATTGRVFNGTARSISEFSCLSTRVLKTSWWTAFRISEGIARNGWELSPLEPIFWSWGSTLRLELALIDVYSLCAEKTLLCLCLNACWRICFFMLGFLFYAFCGVRDVTPA